MSREPRLLFLHGFLSGRTAWSGLRRELHDIETEAVDLLGYGASRRIDGDFSLEALLDHIQPTIEAIQPTHVIGHSMGGLVALALARRMPCQFEAVGVIGLPVFRNHGDGTSHLRSRVVHRNFLRAGRYSHFACVGMHRTSRLWLPFSPLLLPRQPREVLRATFDHCREGHYGSLRHVVFAGLVADLPAEVKTPVFALHGARDRTAPIERVRELAAEHGWDLRVAPNSGHQLPIEKPRIAARWIREFVLAGAQRETAASSRDGSPSPSTATGTTRSG